MKSSFWIWRHKILDGSYNIGFINAKDSLILSPNLLKTVKWLDTAGNTDGWFADPFVLDVNENNIVVLAEEYLFNENKGRISQLIIDRESFKLLKVVPLISKPFHLSFPYIIREKSEIFICPESAKAHNTQLYNLKKIADSQRIVQEPLLDSQLVKVNGVYYLFGVKTLLNSLEDTKTLYIYTSSNIEGPYTPLGIIENDKCEERGAGAIFSMGGQIIRPAQICEGGYGKGIVFYALDFGNGKVTETEMARIYADSKYKNGLCFHTFSPYKDIIAIDGFDYPIRSLGRLAPKIYGIKAYFLRWLNKQK